MTTCEIKVKVTDMQIVKELIHCLSDNINDLPPQVISKLKELNDSGDTHEQQVQIEQLTERNNPAVAAIQYAIDDPFCKEFLQLWNEGDFDAIRKEWDDVPDEVFDGADPFFNNANQTK